MKLGGPLYPAVSDPLAQLFRHSAHFLESHRDPINHLLLLRRFAGWQEAIPLCELFAAGFLNLFKRGNVWSFQHWCHLPTSYHYQGVPVLRLSVRTIVPRQLGAYNYILEALRSAGIVGRPRRAWTLITNVSGFCDVAT